MISDEFKPASNVPATTEDHITLEVPKHISAPWAWMIIDGPQPGVEGGPKFKTFEEMGKFITDMLANAHGAKREMTFVTTSDGKALIAITGNGANRENHAKLIAGLPNVLRMSDLNIMLLLRAEVLMTKWLGEGDGHGPEIEAWLRDLRRYSDMSKKATSAGEMTKMMDAMYDEWIDEYNVLAGKKADAEATAR